jgi:hypothetical protein
VELALIGSASSGRRGTAGANVTHVIGQQLEWHAELLWHDSPLSGDRVVSAVAGAQYTFRSGVNMIVEYHRNGAGLNQRAWDAVLRGERNPGLAPSRRQFLFVRTARASADHAMAPELIVIAGLDDGGWTLVPAMTWTFQSGASVYVRATHLAGGRRTVVGLAPWSTAVTVGAVARF